MLNLRPAPEISQSLAGPEPRAGEVPFHALANLFPMIGESGFGELVEAIRANGQRQRIVLHQGRILDGRNRYRACLAAGVEPRFTLFGWKAAAGIVGEMEGAIPPDFVIAAALAAAPLDEQLLKRLPAPLRFLDPGFTVSGLPGDALAYVLDENLTRRHLSESQRAMVAANLEGFRHGGVRRGDGAEAVEPQLDRGDAARMLNVGERSVARAAYVRDHGAPELRDAVSAGTVSIAAAAEVAHRPAAEQAEIVARGKSEVMRLAKQFRAADQAVKREKRLAKSAQIARGNGPLPDRRYNVIYLDPAWRFAVRSEETGMDRSADNHYPTMTLDELLALNTGRIAAADCVMFMWATVPNLLDALAMMKAAGFEYKSHAAWDKDERGTGFWFINQHELLLVGTKGDIAAPLPGTQALSVHREKRGPHSAKPVFFRDMIARLYPDVPKIELNCRDPAPGWDVWGNQSGEAGQEQPGPEEEVPAPVAKQVKVKPAKASKLSEWEAERDRIAALAKELPDDLDGLKAAMGRAIDRYDSAISSGNAEDAVSAARAMKAAIERAGQIEALGGRCPAARMKLLERACMAPLGEVPKWGQAGVFLAEHEGIRALVTLGHRSSTAIHAVDFNAPFPSSTGYQSMCAERAEGGSVAEYGAALIAASVAYNKKNGIHKKLCLPESIYAIDPAEADGLRYIQRGVRVDPDAPPAGIDVAAALALFAEWEADDLGRWSGGKKGKGRFPKRSAHPNDFIAALTPDGLEPVAEFPTRGAYVMRAREWGDQGQVLGLRYVADAANPVCSSEAAT